MTNFFTITEAARICSINRSTMHRWVVSGKINSYKTPGGRIRIQKSALKAFFEKNQMPIDLVELKDSKKRILIVDDDTAIQNYLRDVLTGPFMEIEVASDGFEAGVKLMEFKPDLILLDLNIPKQDGFQVCQMVKQKTSTNKIKILIMTGHGTRENKDKAFLFGADGFLSKPASKKKIINEIERLLG